MITHRGFENSLRAAATSATPIRFSTEDLPERDRTALWREVIGRNVVRLDLEPLSERPLRSDVSVHALPGLTMMRGDISDHKVARTRELITDGNTDFRLEIRLNGREHMSQRGREVVLNEGDAALVCCAAEVVAVQSPGLFLGLHIPRADLAALVPNAEDAVMRRIPRDIPALRLLVNYAGSIYQQGDLATPGLHRSVASHIRELVALSIAAASEVKPDGFAGGRAALLHAIKADILKNLTSPELNLELLAFRHGLQPRYIQRLFQREGATFSQFVIEQRLARAYRILMGAMPADARPGESSIGAIAYACGFNDQSYFNRRFRQHYGMTPSELRETSRAKS